MTTWRMTNEQLRHWVNEHFDNNRSEVPLSANLFALSDIELALHGDDYQVDFSKERGCWIVTK